MLLYNEMTLLYIENIFKFKCFETNWCITVTKYIYSLTYLLTLLIKVYLNCCTVVFYLHKLDDQVL